jgi:NAD(P)-dependent dehydrogenase (short-subunit alcohol dehydrogenase family)
VNLFGSYLIAREALSQNSKVTMIFIASVAGMYGKAEHSGYSASKAAVISLVQSLGMEGHNAYSISPGRVETKMREKDFPGEDKRTRLTTLQVAEVVQDCVNGRYQPGDNVIVRKRGFRSLKRIDKGQPWKVYLNVQPIGTPKTI